MLSGVEFEEPLCLWHRQFTWNPGHMARACATSNTIEFDRFYMLGVFYVSGHWTSPDRVEEIPHDAGRSLQRDIVESGDQRLGTTTPSDANCRRLSTL